MSNRHEDICENHVKVATDIVTLCGSLKWMVKIGAFAAPFVIAFAAYIILQLTDIKQQVAVQSVKIDAFYKEFIAQQHTLPHNTIPERSASADKWRE